MRTRIAIIALNETFDRSWIKSGILNELKQHHDITVFSSYDNKNTFAAASLAKYINTESLKRATFLKNLAWIAHRNTCISFKFNLKRWYFSNFYWYQTELSFRSRVKFLLKQIAIFVKKCTTENRLTIFFVFPFKKFLLQIALKRFKQITELRTLLTEFDLIIYHACSQEKEFPIIQNSIKDSQTKSLMVLESWDNLTSKQIFLFKPDYIGVIGDLDVENAKSIHNFRSDQIFKVGLPKFNVLKSFKYNQPPAMQKDSKTILYVGFFLPHDEITILNEIQKVLTDIKQDYRLLYRPHPVAKTRLINHELDPRVKITRSWNGKELPDLNNEYMSDVLASDLVIGPPTTFLLECILIGAPTIIDLTDDKIHRTNSSNSTKNYLHMKQFVSIFNQNTFKSTDELKNLLISNDFRGSDQIQKINSIVHLDNLSYAGRLDQIIKQILPDKYIQKNI